MKSQIGTKANRWLTRCGYIGFSLNLNSKSFFQLVERNVLLTLCYSYNLDLHWTPPCSSYYNRWLPDLIKPSLLFENFSSDMSYKTSPSSSLEKSFYPYPELPSLTVYPWVSRFSRWPPGLMVGLENLTDSHKNTISENIVCSFERKSVRVCKVGNKKAKKRNWRSMAMENRWWWTTFGVRADDGTMTVSLKTFSQT